MPTIGPDISQGRPTEPELEPRSRRSTMLQRLPLVSREARHEARLILAANPALFSLLTLGRFVGPVRKVPRVGWVITDPVVARGLLTDSEHTNLLGEGRRRTPLGPAPRRLGQRVIRRPRP